VVVSEGAGGRGCVCMCVAGGLQDCGWDGSEQGTRAPVSLCGQVGGVMGGQAANVTVGAPAPRSGRGTHGLTQTGNMVAGS
jgi:hypothetical protein